MASVDPDLVALFKSLVAGAAPWPLYVHGSVGTGKTLAALCLCDVCRTAACDTVESLCDAVMAAEHPGCTEAMWRRIAAKDLAVLDELGCRQKVGDLHYSVVKRFADERFQQAENVAIYISNLPPEQFRSVYDDRIASRVLSGTWFKLGGPDRRFPT